MINLIEQLKSDHEHGSKAIAMHFLLSCRDWCTTHIIEPDSFLDFLNQVDSARPSMAILKNISQRLRQTLAKNRQHAGCAIVHEINLLLKEMQSSDQLIFEKTKVIFKNQRIRSVLTHSRSATVEYVLRRLLQEEALSSLICTESRPLNEGVALANALPASVHPTVIVDALADAFMPQCDCLLLGADAMDRHGNIVNKIGSRLLALSAKDHGVPVICLAEAMKIIPHNSVTSLSAELHAGTELGHRLNTNIAVTNQYFEVIEKRLLTKIISDKNTSP